MRNLKNDNQLLLARHKLVIIMAVRRKEMW